MQGYSCIYWNICNKLLHFTAFTGFAGIQTKLKQRHIELMPKLTKTAGFEWGTGFYINPPPRPKKQRSSARSQRGGCGAWSGGNAVMEARAPPPVRAKRQREKDFCGGAPNRGQRVL